MPLPIYLDHAATTPLLPEAREAMEPFLTSNFANPSSVYRQAQFARSAIDRARDTVAECLGAHPTEIIFTSGGTESNNAAIKGAVLVRRLRPGHIVTSAIEHHAVLHPVEEQRELGECETTIVQVAQTGIVDAGDVEKAIKSNTILLSIMWANNEIGTIQPVEAIAALAKAHGITMHVDAVQAAGTIGIDLQRVPIDLLSVSAHKFYGPKGVGILFVRNGTPWWPLLSGGGQERNRRAGTENVAGIVGMARALEVVSAERESTYRRVQKLRDSLLQGLTARLPDIHVNGEMSRRLPNNINVSFGGIHGEALLVGLDMADIMASSGSACTSGSLEPSHVLQAIGLSHRLAQSSLRLTLGRHTNQAEIDRTLDVLIQLSTRLRNLAPSARAV